MRIRVDGFADGGTSCLSRFECEPVRRTVTLSAGCDVLACAVRVSSPSTEAKLQDEGDEEVVSASIVTDMPFGMNCRKAGFRGV